MNETQQTIQRITTMYIIEQGLAGIDDDDGRDPNSVYNHVKECLGEANEDVVNRVTDLVLDEIVKFYEVYIDAVRNRNIPSQLEIIVKK